MKAYVVVLEESVCSELEAAYAWIAREAPQAAVDWYNECIDTIRTLEHLPGRCPVAPEARFFDVQIRHLIVGPYRVLFTIEGDVVHVLHVRHGARQPFGT